MGLPNNEQYIRALALENATRLVASANRSERFSIDEILDVADKFADYIQYGRVSDAS